MRTPKYLKAYEHFLLFLLILGNLFSLEAQPVSNGTCSTAVSIAGGCSPFQGDQFLDQLSPVENCNLSITNYSSIWFEFIPTHDRVYIYFNNQTQSTETTQLAVYSGSCGSLTCIASTASASFPLVVENLNTNITLKLQVFFPNSGNYFSSNFTFEICIESAVAASNDEANNPQVLGYQKECNIMGQSLLYARAGPASICPNTPANSANDDLWYELSVPAYGSAFLEILTIQQPGSQYQPLVAEIYTSGYFDCTTTQLDLGTIGRDYLYILPSLTIETYQIRIFSLASYALLDGTTFGICASSYPTNKFVKTEVLQCLSNDNPSHTVSTGSGQWLHLLYNGEIFASVLDSESMGQMSGSFYINRPSFPLRSINDIEIMDRNFEIQVATQPTNSVSIRFFYTQSEFNKFKNANDGDPNDVNSKNDLMLTKVNSNNDCSNPQVNGPGNAQFSQSNSGTLFGMDYIAFDIPSFSSFVLTGNNTALPIVLSSFKVSQGENRIWIDWVMQETEDLESFEIERSNDGTNFNSIGQLKFDKKIMNYRIEDAFPINTTTLYYRLKMVTIDGTHSYSDLKSINKEYLLSNWSIYPNPASDYLNVSGPKKTSARVEILDLRGTEIKHYSDLSRPLDVSSLLSGIYIVRIDDTANKTYFKMLKK